jgi:hypothetical protein
MEVVVGEASVGKVEGHEKVLSEAVALRPPRFDGYIALA